MYSVTQEQNISNIDFVPHIHHKEEKQTKHPSKYPNYAKSRKKYYKV